MPNDDFEKRIMALERLLDKAILKMDGLEKSIEVLWKKIDSRIEKETERDQRVAIMLNEHAECKKRHEKEANWISGRFGSLVDKLLPGVIMAAMMYMAMKGGVLK